MDMEINASVIVFRSISASMFVHSNPQQPIIISREIIILSMCMMKQAFNVHTLTAEQESFVVCFNTTSHERMYFI